MSSPRRRFTSPRGRKPTGLAKKYPRPLALGSDAGEGAVAADAVPLQHPPRRILVADGSPESAAGTAFVLARAGYRVSTAGTIDEARREISCDRFDLMLLDAVLGGASTLDFLRSLQARGSAAMQPERLAGPSVVVTLDAAATTDEQRYRALAEGADDVLIRPFDARELLMRTAVLLRRVAVVPSLPTDVFRLGSLYIDFAGHQVMVGDRTVDLTRREFGVLQQLAEHCGRLCTRSALTSGGARAGPAGGRGIDMCVSRMRRKLGSAGAMIENVRGKGYRLRLVRPMGVP